MAIDERQLFDAVRLEMSPAFRRRLERDLVAAAQHEVEEDVMVKVVEHEVGHGGDESNPTRTEPTASWRRHMKVVLAAAASVALVAALAVVPELKTGAMSLVSVMVTVIA